MRKTVITAIIISIIFISHYMPQLNRAECQYHTCKLKFQKWESYSSKFLKKRSQELKAIDAKVREFAEALKNQENKRFLNMEKFAILQQIEVEIGKWRASKGGTASIRDKEVSAVIQCIEREIAYIRDAVRELEIKEMTLVPELASITGDTHKYISTAATGQSGASDSYFDRHNTTDAIQGIFKPCAKEGFLGPQHFPEGGSALREAMAYSLSKEMGIPIIPYTRLARIDDPVFKPVSRRGVMKSNYKAAASSLQVGSYQKGVAHVIGDLKKYLENKPGLTQVLPFDLDTLQWMAIIDIVTLNSDRHLENLMLQRAPAPRRRESREQQQVVQPPVKLIPIDHGRAFPSFMMCYQRMSTADRNTMWAWAKLPESEEQFSDFNKGIARGLTISGRNNFLDKVRDLADKRARVLALATGDSEETYKITEDIWAMIKLSILTFKECIKHNLTPAQIETIYKKRSGEWSHTAVRGKFRTVPINNDGGEFAELIFQMRKKNKLKDGTRERQFQRAVEEMMKKALLRMGLGSSY
jgi:hypothetical protein